MERGHDHGFLGRSSRRHLLISVGAAALLIGTISLGLWSLESGTYQQVLDRAFKVITAAALIWVPVWLLRLANVGSVIDQQDAALTRWIESIVRAMVVLQFTAILIIVPLGAMAIIGTRVPDEYALVGEVALLLFPLTLCVSILVSIAANVLLFAGHRHS